MSKRRKQDEAKGKGKVSLAEAVLQTVERLQQLTGSGGPDGSGAADPLLRDHSVREVTLSLAYGPGSKGAPLPLPPSPDGPPVMSWAEARAYLLANDRRVILDTERLRRAPADRVARLELTIRFT